MTIKSVICDIDGVLLHRIQEAGMPLIILTNYPSQTAQDLA
ncbi:UMP phosphatase, partial [Yersinia enterocolitica]|nr:UMP phosphatase [Yersinia enterocolitica]